MLFDVTILPVNRLNALVGTPINYVVVATSNGREVIRLGKYPFEQAIAIRNAITIAFKAGAETLTVNKSQVQPTRMETMAEKASREAAKRKRHNDKVLREFGLGKYK